LPTVRTWVTKKGGKLFHVRIGQLICGPITASSFRRKVVKSDSRIRQEIRNYSFPSTTVIKQFPCRPSMEGMLLHSPMAGLLPLSMQLVPWRSGKQSTTRLAAIHNKHPSRVHANFHCHRCQQPMPAPMLAPRRLRRRRRPSWRLEEPRHAAKQRSRHWRQRHVQPHVQRRRKHR